AIGFSASGQRLAACDRDLVVRIWTVGSWRECDQFHVPADHDELHPEHLVFSPDERQLLVSRVDIVALWDFGTRGWVWDSPGHNYSSRSSPPAFDTDGSRIMIPAENSWIDAQTGKTHSAYGDTHRNSLMVYRLDKEPD